jgi:vancomycin resistance protein VanJ
MAGAPVPVARRWLRAATVICAAGYPVALIAVIAALRLIGERWWVTLTGLYLPRIGFALPLPFVLVSVRLWGSRRLLWLQSISVALLIFPLMGLSPGPGRVFARREGPVLRVMSCNVKFQSARGSAVAAQARGFAADIVLLQDAPTAMDQELRKAFDGWTVSHDGEFLLATRFHVLGIDVPPDLVYPQGAGGAHYVHYALATPVGPVGVLNVHTTSPRSGLEEVRGNGLRFELMSGRLFSGRAAGPAEWNAFRRARQVAGIAERADAITDAVIIAGDTNLPGLSWILGEHLGHFRDGFNQAGLGFGYTYPARRPWMRLDRILTNDRLRAIDFRVGSATGSDHRAVFAVLARDAG